MSLILYITCYRVQVSVCVVCVCVCVCVWVSEWVCVGGRGCLTNAMQPRKEGEDSQQLPFLPTFVVLSRCLDHRGRMDEGVRVYKDFNIRVACSVWFSTVRYGWITVTH